MKIDDGTYRVLVAGTDQESHLIDFNFREFDGYCLSIIDVDASGRPYHHVTAALNFDRQQLTEFGALLLFLGGDGGDLDSIPELLEGYGVSDENMKEFARRLQQLAEDLFSHVAV